MIALVLDAILVAVPVEAVALAAFHARTGRGLPPGAFLANLAAGFCLLLAARFAVPAGSATFPPAIALAVPRRRLDASRPISRSKRNHRQSSR